LAQTRVFTVPRSTASQLAKNLANFFMGLLLR
jgi:hypothetical protein